MWINIIFVGINIKGKKIEEKNTKKKVYRLYRNVTAKAYDIV